jgi:hypothetical protein
MSLQRMDANAAEMLAGPSGCCAEQRSSCGRLPMPRVSSRLDKCWGWASTWPGTKRATSCRARFQSMGLCRSGVNRPISSLRRAAAAAHVIPGVRAVLDALPARVGGPPGVGSEHWRTTDRRTVWELPAECDALAGRRSWTQLSSTRRRW